jgi:hypothetical protein
MSERKKAKSDENYEKPSRHRQWQEKSERPIAARAMTEYEIENHRMLLVSSYQCDDTDITYDFEKIKDENDEDRDDCLWLKYKMKCVVAGKPTIKDVFSIKVPIPEELKIVAQKMRKAQAARTRAQRKPNLSLKALPAPIKEEPTEEPVVAVPTLPALVDVAVSEEPVETRPKLRKPVRVIKK